MRTLRFNINEQIIEKDPNCDFSRLVPGTKGYLKAEFSFSPEWNNCVKIASFYSSGKEYPYRILKDGCSCYIPEEVLNRRVFKIMVVGKNKDGLVLTTNKVVVTQNGGEQG